MQIRQLYNQSHLELFYPPSQACFTPCLQSNTLAYCSKAKTFYNFCSCSEWTQAVEADEHIFLLLFLLLQLCMVIVLLLVIVLALSLLALFFHLEFVHSCITKPSIVIVTYDLGSDINMPAKNKSSKHQTRLERLTMDKRSSLL